MSNNFEDGREEIRDPMIDTLGKEVTSHLRSRDQRETTHQESLNRQQQSYDSIMGRKHRQANLLEDVEQGRAMKLRKLRSELQSELLAHEDVAGKAFSELGIEYVPGQSTSADIFNALGIPEGEAARQAGVPISVTLNDKLVKFLKYGGMVGCTFLSTFGLGALIFHQQPRQLIHSPMLIGALGLGLIIVGSAYTIISPTLRRHGAESAVRPHDKKTKQGLVSCAVLIGVTGVLIGLLDAKAIGALNASRALVNPEAAPSFAVNFLLAMALSGSYVMGIAMDAFNHAFGHGAKKMIEAVQQRHVQEQRKTLEVTQAIQALNSIQVVKGRLANLDREIKIADEDYREELGRTYAGSPDAPDISNEQHRELRYKDQEIKFAGQRVTAFELLKARLRGEK